MKLLVKLINQTSQAGETDVKKKANVAAYSQIVQRPYGLGVAKTLLRGWRHRQACGLDGPRLRVSSEGLALGEM